MTHGLSIAILAAACMVVQDTLGTIMVQAEAANRGWLAGLCDMVGWYFSIGTTSISVAAINGHGGFWPKFWVFSIVGISNIFGTKLGQVSGQWILKRQLTLADKLAIQAESRK